MANKQMKKKKKLSVFHLEKSTLKPQRATAIYLLEWHKENLTLFSADKDAEPLERSHIM